CLPPAAGLRTWRELYHAASTDVNAADAPCFRASFRLRSGGPAAASLDCEPRVDPPPAPVHRSRRAVVLPSLLEVSRAARYIEPCPCTQAVQDPSVLTRVADSRSVGGT